jgi:hypothetical protein
MKILQTCLLVIGIIALPVAAKDGKAKKDPIEQGLREAFSAYQKEDLEAVTAKLQEVLKAIDERKAAKVGAVLPDELGDWKAGELEREDLAAIGGGISVKRTYKLEEKSITAKLVKDSPLVDKWLKILSNRDALKFTGKKVHTIDGEAALVDSERKILIGIESEVLLELVGDNDCEAKDILAFARKLDLKTMKALE